MTDRALRRSATAVTLVNAGLVMVGASLLASTIGGPTAAVEDTWGFRGSGSLYGFTITLIACFITRRVPRHPVGWALLSAGVCASLLAFGEGYGLYSIAHPATTLPGVGFVNWITSGIWIPMLGSITYMLLLFPAGTLPSPRWRPVAWIVPPAVILPVITESFSAGVLDSGVVKVVNPYGVLEVPVWLKDIAPVPLVFCLLAAAVSVAVRMPRARGEERAQLKWLGYAGLFLATTLVAFGVVAPVVPSLTDPLEAINALSVVGLPLATGIAILKYRLYDIDIIINRTLVYGALTAILGAVYFGLVVAFQGLLSPVTEQSDIAVAASTLAVAALFGPVRRRVQAFIDRRFYRSRYDAQKTLESFSARLRDEIDLEHLSSELIRVVAASLRPRHAGLWLARSDESHGNQQ